MTTTDWIQAIATGVLVVITAIYAWRTFAISRSTEKQADASVKMAEEMKEQMIHMAQPRLTPDLKTQTRGDFFIKESNVIIGNTTSAKYGFGYAWVVAPQER